MGASCLTKTDPAAPWPDLPPEIPGLIFCRLPSHDDRRSFGAVCRSWRLAVRQQSPLPPPMPCINLGYGAYQSLIDGKVRCFPTPKQGYRVGASFGGWLFNYNDGSDSDDGRCFLRGLFSAAAAIEVPTCYHTSPVDFPTAMATALGTHFDTMLVGPGMDMKMVVCSSQLVVALFRHPDTRHSRRVSYLASFRPAALQQRLLVSYFVVQPHDHDHHPRYVYTDISFFQRKLFAVSSREDLFCHDLSTVDRDTNHHLLPVICHDIHAQQDMLSNCYLVVSSDKKKLLMVRWRRGNDQRSIYLRVFEADFGEGRWLEVKDLGDQILFLSRNCSIAFAVASSEHWGRRFRGGNHVFVLGTEWARSLGQPAVSCKMDTPN